MGSHTDHDPYSWAMQRIVPTLTQALIPKRRGTMSDDEFAILNDIRTIIETRDPEALNMPNVRIVTRPLNRREV